MQTTDRFGQGFQNESRFPPYIYAKSKRIRNKNWELLEIQVLKKMIDNHYDLLNSRHTNAMMNARKNLVWKRIAESINALGLHKRTVRELKIKWSNIRLTERRKSGSQNTSTSGAPDGGSSVSDDIVDISQSSFESDNQVAFNGSCMQENGIPSSGITPKVIPDMAKSCQRQIPLNEETSVRSNQQHMSSDQMETRPTQVEQYLNATKHNVTEDRINQRVQQEPFNNRLTSWSLDESTTYSGRPTQHQVDVRPPQRENILDFSQDRIYMPGVIIKPEPNECSQVGNCNNLDVTVNNFQTSSTQTEWRLSCFEKYECPSLPVSEREVASIKYEILKLEREHLLLKNKNMELQNKKLEIEISKFE